MFNNVICSLKHTENQMGRTVENHVRELRLQFIVYLRMSRILESDT